MIRRMTLSLRPPYDEGELMKAARRDLGCAPAHFRILKKSVDARNKSDVRVVCTFEYGDSLPPDPPVPERVARQRKVLVVGSGPAGMFCAVRLADRGLRPVLIERGADVDGRARDVGAFFGGGELDEESNVQFGEGGAGTFSDGKLNTNTHNGYVAEVYRTFVRFGAPAETLYLNKPHIGSDVLRGVVKNMRSHIISCGGEARFRTRLDDFVRRTGGVEAVLTGENGAYSEYFDDAVLAVGHSARDTFAVLRARGYAMESRDFAVGVRIEHLQRDIDEAQYGAFAKYLPPADYKAVSDAGERKVFTFCMCPGGFVVPAQSERGTVVTNGMSLHARGGGNANAALLAQVTRADFGSDDPLAGAEYQRRIERAAYEMTGGYSAPAMTVGDFLRDPYEPRSHVFVPPAEKCDLPEYADVTCVRTVGEKNGAAVRGKSAAADCGEVLPTYARGVKFAPLGCLLPDYVVCSLQAGIRDIAKRIRGFDNPHALLTAPETRFSSPVRVLRGDNFAALGTDNIYPCGEGAGYSGGITSSACDGMRIADAVCAKCM